MCTTGEHRPGLRLPHGGLDAQQANRLLIAPRSLSTGCGLVAKELISTHIRITSHFISDTLLETHIYSLVVTVTVQVQKLAPAILQYRK
eukprot:SAG25_NODE_288_length_10343_cov_3.673858_12_plen_89_part_00